jgi:hypothetical protein
VRRVHDVHRIAVGICDRKGNLDELETFQAVSYLKERTRRPALAVFSGSRAAWCSCCSRT